MAEMAKSIQASRSIIDVLNYLSRHGWELFNVTTVQTDGHKSSLDASNSYIDSETRYLLRRRPARPGYCATGTTSSDGYTTKVPFWVVAGL